jgi:hypothetical protein
MHVFEVTSKVIYAIHGWAVAEQFDDTCTDTSTFDDQNTNALRCIQRTVKELLNDGPFDEDATEELREYLVELNEYLQGWEEEEDEA